MRTKRLLRRTLIGALIPSVCLGVYLLTHPALFLSYNAFDRTPGSGWRSLYERGDYAKAGTLIQAYLLLHGMQERPPDRAVLHFHAAQMFAVAGNNSQAMSQLNRAPNPILGVEWNTMLDATKAFLTQDRPGLTTARARLTNGPASERAIEAVDRLIAHFGEPYAPIVRAENEWAGKWAEKSPDKSLHKETLLAVNGIHLSCLDWGGQGECILFLAGLGSTAHVFDDFAPRFTNHFRVLGLTRRGFGKSDQPKTGYDSDTLSDDIRLFLDGLGIQRVILIGHSIAGGEMTRFAGKYPERTAKLVYLDAAYDRSVEKKMHFETLPMPAPDYASVPGYLQYMKTIYRIWSDALENDTLAGIDVAPDGWLVESLSGGDAFGQIVKGEAPPDYSRVNAPALAIFAMSEHLFENSLAWLPRVGEATRKKAQANDALLVKGRREQIERFRKEVKNGVVYEMPDTVHHCFIQKPDEVFRRMEEFLLIAQ